MSKVGNRNYIREIINGADVEQLMLDVQMDDDTDMTFLYAQCYLAKMDYIDDASDIYTKIRRFSRQVAQILAVQYTLKMQPHFDKHPEKYKY